MDMKVVYKGSVAIVKNFNSEFSMELHVFWNPESQQLFNEMSDVYVIGLFQKL